LATSQAVIQSSDQQCVEQQSIEQLATGQVVIKLSNWQQVEQQLS
jgi:hypothetical protein